MHAVEEGAFWLSFGQSPYIDGTSIVYQPPLVLFLHTLLRDVSPITADALPFVLAAIADAVGALAIYRAGRGLKRSELNTGSAALPKFVAALYLFNPQSIGPCVAGSSAAYNNAAILLCIAAAVEGSSPTRPLFHL